MSKRTQFWRKVVASVVAYTLVFAQIAPSAYAASTDISDIPLAVKNQVAPNIMMTLDDSGSMHWEFLPEDDMFLSLYMYPYPVATYGVNIGTGDMLVPNFKDNNIHNFFSRSSQNNKAYYNPNVTYRPWSNPDGANWAQANPSAAYYNPARTVAGTLDLTTQRTQSAIWFSDWNGSAFTGNRATAFCDPCFANHSYWPITYFKYNGGNVNLRASYTKEEIRNTDPASNTYSYVGPLGPATRTKAEEVQNFANWFQYYRSRISTARAGISRSFATLSTTPRIGFGAINQPGATIDGIASPGTIVRGVRQFTGTSRTDFFNSLFNLPIGNSGTPLRQAMDDVGVYFSRTDNTGPWGANPGVGGGSQLSCRQNFNIMMTDGYWNTGLNPARTAAARANVDNTAGPTHTGVADPVTGVIPSFTYTPATPFNDGNSDTLADVAMYYWVRDLRPDMINNVLTSTTDNAFWQHMSVYGVALGVFGTIPQATIQSAFATPYPTINWPAPTSSNRAKIDDLAHAGINARGGFFSAASPDELATGLANALANISARTAAGSAVGITSANVVSGDNRLFASSYLPGFTWSGDLKSHAIDPATALPIEPPTWSAQPLLDARSPNPAAANGRFIATHTGAAGNGQGIRFQRVTFGGPNKLSPAQEALLDTPLSSPADGGAVVDYLRGDRTAEATGVYRQRVSLLGDIVNSQPVVVRPPSASYSDAGYASFRAANETRRQIVLQGANDGMLHAFDAGTAQYGSPPSVTAATPGTGQERWAYVPSLLFSSLNNLSRIVGYTKKSYVDATPVSGDIDFNKAPGFTGSPDWRTIAVGGLGKGGRGYYALDVTSTLAADEVAVANKVLWEFPNSGTVAADRLNVGFTFGKPIVTKTRANGWVAIVASGYNNGTNAGDSGGTGQGYLFVLNARTGALIRAISTGVGTVGDPSGLAHIVGYAELADADNTVQYVYGGDLKGNVWRFDLTGATTASWSVTKLATLVDGSGNFQPISAEMELAKITINGVAKRFVYVGTGLLMGDTDLPGSVGANAHATQTQTMYGLVDDLSVPAAGTAVITPLRASLQQQTLTNIGTTGNRNASQNTVDFNTKKGWFVDFTASGERVNTPPMLGLGSLVFTTNVPSSDLCTLVGTSYFNVLDYQTGGLRTGVPAGLPSSIRAAQGQASGVVLVRLADGTLVGVSRIFGAVPGYSSNPVTGPGGGGVTKRRSWRELLQ